MVVWKELKDNPRLKTAYTARLDIIRLVREFFWSQNFQETDTPIALRYPGQEPYLHPVPVTLHDPLGRPEPFYLHTSPEFAMKKLLAAGFPKIFQLAKCFRDYEAWGDGTHNTEFTLLEWYRAPGTLAEIMNDAESLFKYVGIKLGFDKLRYRNKEIIINESWEKKTMKQLWLDYLGVDLDLYLEIEPLQKLSQKLGFPFTDADEYEDLFFKIFLNKIEPYLGLERPTFVYDYPTRMCSLSRVCAYDPRYAERAELYVGGLELANGFGELTDPVEQQTRLTADQALRQKLGKPTWPVDPDFIAALESGIPAKNPANSTEAGLPAIARRATAGGIALGVDRMVMLFTGARNLNEVLFQSVGDQLIIK